MQWQKKNYMYIPDQMEIVMCRNGLLWKTSNVQNQGKKQTLARRNKLRLST